MQGGAAAAKQADNRIAYSSPPTSWRSLPAGLGCRLRFGLTSVSAHDFALIVAAMGAKV